LIRGFQPGIDLQRLAVHGDARLVEIATAQESSQVCPHMGVMRPDRQVVLVERLGLVELAVAMQGDGTPHQLLQLLVDRLRFLLHWSDRLAFPFGFARADAGFLPSGFSRLPRQRKKIFGRESDPT
jgi:hypothetical protein